VRVLVKVPGLMLSMMLLGACADSIPPAPDPEVAASNAGVAAIPDPLLNGQKIYGEYCFSCHTPGLNGAPKLGDEEGWAPRIAKGEALLLQTTIEGIPPAMPPRGICMSCTDEELRDAIAFMIAKSQ
jgi:cytochrome c5